MYNYWGKINYFLSNQVIDIKCYNNWFFYLIKLSNQVIDIKCYNNWGKI